MIAQLHGKCWEFSRAIYRMWKVEKNSSWRSSEMQTELYVLSFFPISILTSRDKFSREIFINFWIKLFHNISLGVNSLHYKHWNFILKLCQLGCFWRHVTDFSEQHENTKERENAPFIMIAKDVFCFTALFIKKYFRIVGRELRARIIIN